MENNFILYPAVILMILTLFLYVKNYLDNTTAFKNKIVKCSYFTAYQDKDQEYIEVSRQTLKSQFELPILFYFLICIILIFDQVMIIDHILAWMFVISRYIHCYIRLTSNYVPYRAKAFKVGLLILIAWWINFLVYNL